MKIARIIIELVVWFMFCSSVISPDADVKYVIFFSTMYLGIVIRNVAHQEGEEK